MSYDPERIINIGELEKRGKTVRFGIKEKDRSRHIYVIGQTGTGKSTLLEMLAMQDIRNGTGLIFMDPHGQSVEALLNYVTREHLDKIIYFAPHHQERPIGLNIMEDIGYDKRHLVVSSLMASFEKIWGAGTWSDRMAYILQNTLLALIEYPGTTLLDVGRMYTSKDFREKVVANLKDPQVRKYWVEEFANYTERYAQEATPSIQNKLGQFTSNPLMRNIIGQKQSAFNFREIMDEGKILLVNLSKGQIGENNARMLGVLFTTKIYLAALSRSDMTKPELEVANPCNFFVDEFQSFANSSFSDILSEARKYKLNLVMAHQYLGQLYTDDSGGGDAIRDAVFGNVGTFVSFRVGPVDAEIISKQFAPEVEEEDLVALPRYHIYLTLNIDGAGSTPFSARTFYEPAPDGVSLEEEVVQLTMDTYGVDRAVIEKIVADNLEEDAQAAKKGGGNGANGKKQGGGKPQGKGGGQQQGKGKGGGQQRNGQEKTHQPLKGLVAQVMGQSASQKEVSSEEKGKVSEKAAAEVQQSGGGRDDSEKKQDVFERKGKKRNNENAESSVLSVPEDADATIKENPSLLKKLFSRSKKHADSVVADGGKEEVLAPPVAEGAAKDGSASEAASQKDDFKEVEEVQKSGKKQEYVTRRIQVVKRGGQQDVEKKEVVQHRSSDSKSQEGSRSTAKRERGDVARAQGQSGVAGKPTGGRQSQKPSASRTRQQRVRSAEEKGKKEVQHTQKQERNNRDQQKKQRGGDERKSRRQEKPSIPVASRDERKKSRSSYAADTAERGVVRAKVQVAKDSQSTQQKGQSAQSSRQDKNRAQKERRDTPPKRTEEVRDGRRIARRDSEAVRRPNGVAGGAVSRTAAVQSREQPAQQVATKRSVQQKQEGRKEEKHQKGDVSHSGLGGLIDSTRGSGLKKDLKIAPKKEKKAPPVRYEEGWVSLGDIHPATHKDE